MSYGKALEKAGAEILAYESFGSYQGDWWAKVKYEGKVGWVHGSYGSCSSCDAFEAEFGWGASDQCEKHEYSDPVPECADCQAKAASLDRRLADFGKGYLDPLFTQEQAEKSASRDLDWDLDAKDMVQFIKDNAIKEGD